MGGWAVNKKTPQSLEKKLESFKIPFDTADNNCIIQAYKRQR